MSYTDLDFRLLAAARQSRALIRHGTFRCGDGRITAAFTDAAARKRAAAAKRTDILSVAARHRGASR